MSILITSDVSCIFSDDAVNALSEQYAAARQGPDKCAHSLEVRKRTAGYFEHTNLDTPYAVQRYEELCHRWLRDRLRLRRFVHFYLFFPLVERERVYRHTSMRKFSRVISERRKILDYIPVYTKPQTIGYARIYLTSRYSHNSSRIVRAEGQGEPADLRVPSDAQR